MRHIGERSYKVHVFFSAIILIQRASECLYSKPAINLRRFFYRSEIKRNEKRKNHQIKIYIKINIVIILTFTT